VLIFNLTGISENNVVDYRGICAVIIAISIGSCLVLTVLGLAWRDKQLTKEGGEVISAIGGVFVGSLLTYMGMRK
jgi:hypothetical protein